MELWVEGASRIHERARWTRSLTTEGAGIAPARGPRRDCSPDVWRNIRIAILLLILGIAAYSNWYDRLSTTDWDETLYIGVFPIDDAGNEVARDYIAAPRRKRIADIEQFLNREAQRYGIGIARPVSVELYPPVTERPPERAATNVFRTCGGA